MSTSQHLHYRCRKTGLGAVCRSGQDRSTDHARRARTAHPQPCLCQMQPWEEFAHSAKHMTHLHLSSCGSRAVMHMFIKGLKLF